MRLSPAPAARLGTGRGVGPGWQVDHRDLAALHAQTHGIEGWLRDDEAVFLYAAARFGAGAGAIVEVGSWEGRSTVALALGSKRAGREKVCAVDPHTGSAEHGPTWTLPGFTENLQRAGVDDWVIPLVIDSDAAAARWIGPVRLLWIDGAHEYGQVQRDVALWSTHLIEGGIIALHDTIGWFAGPRRVVAQLLRSGRYRRCGIVGITTYAQRTPAIGFADRVGNYLTLGRRVVLELAGRR